MIDVEHAEKPGRPAAQPGPVPLLFLIADTGGGHRAAAAAVAGALERGYPGRYTPVWFDPLAGPAASRVLRLITRAYGPVVRLAPWLWGAIYHATDSRLAARLLRRTLRTVAGRSLTDALATVRPAAVVSFHPLAGQLAARSWLDQTPAGRTAALVAVITDLGVPHATWRAGGADLIVTPASGSAQARTTRTGRRPGSADPIIPAGLPVGDGFRPGPATQAERGELRRSVGQRESGFLVVLTGGGEGAGRLGRRAAAVLRGLPDVDLAVICGRNARLRHRLARLAARSDGRLTVHGFVPDMAPWLRCADLVVSKAGPGTIAEAACCGAPILLMSRLPGQERGGVQRVTRAGAGRYLPRTRQLVTAIGQLKEHPADLAAMGAASARLGRPGAADHLATLLDRLVRARGPAAPAAQDRMAAAGRSHG
ncbi:MAG TPA: glycosyltransferase [Streptosporangiaceae bacterium]|nr:glycosyltransferase [Streptosporangiaceae bacterium]HEX5294689.1 glycosyltransferase [Streptosporangiaceae bacterium]